MMSRYCHALFVVAAAVGLLEACGSRQPDPAPASSPPAVSVVELQPERVAITSEWIATLDGYVNAQIRPQVSGYLIDRQYDEGARVRKGQVLFEIDPRPFENVLAQAEARLAGAQADLGRTERDVQRDTPLAKERAIPQSQLDNDIQANLSAQALVKSAQAEVDTAKLNLDFTKVHSLIDGVAAIATAQMGDLVGPATLLTTVSQIDPIRVYFSLSEQEYLAVAPQLNRAATAKGIWNTGNDLKLRLADGSEYPIGGTFLAADRQIDPRTGTIRISATFPNPSHLLRPGQYGRVEARTRVVDGALLVPQRAVSEMQGASQLRVVGADGKAHVVNITLGSRVGSRWIITHGLTTGARVIVDAPQLRENTGVTTRPYVGDDASGPAVDGSTAAGKS